MSTPLTDVDGIGPSTADDLQAHDIESAEDLATSSLEEIMTIPGFGVARALKLKEAATAAVGTTEKTAEPTAKKEKPKEKKKDKKKNKKKKTDKMKKSKKGKKKK